MYWSSKGTMRLRSVKPMSARMLSSVDQSAQCTVGESRLPEAVTISASDGTDSRPDGLSPHDSLPEPADARPALCLKNCAWTVVAVSTSIDCEEAAACVGFLGVACVELVESVGAIELRQLGALAVTSEAPKMYCEDLGRCT